MAFFAPLHCLDPPSYPMLTWPFPFTPNAYLEYPISPHAHLAFIHSPRPMFTFHSFPHQTPYSPGPPLHSLCLPCISLLLGIRRVSIIETLGKPHRVMMASLIVYCPKCLGSHGLLCPPPTLPSLDPQSCPMLTWPFPFTPYAYFESPITPHVHLVFIHSP